MINCVQDKKWKRKDLDIKNRREMKRKVLLDAPQWIDREKVIYIDMEEEKKRD